MGDRTPKKRDKMRQLITSKAKSDFPLMGDVVKIINASFGYSGIMELSERERAAIIITTAMWEVLGSLLSQERKMEMVMKTVSDLLPEAVSLASK